MRGSWCICVRVLALASVIACCGFAGCGPNPAFKDEYIRFASIEVGIHESEVREALGKPNYVYLEATAPKRYYVDGYSFKKRPITNKVLIYIAAEPIAYVYLDDNDKVEEVFVGGS